MPDERFHDPGLPLEEYLEVVLAVCPTCGACARIAREPDGGAGPFADRRMTCAACGLVRRWPPPDTPRRGYATGHAQDPWFGEPLWLRTEVRSEVLWAYGPDHLTLIRDFVAATHRTADAGSRRRIHSLANRLPKWIGDASNREPILKAIAKLEATLPG